MVFAHQGGWDEMLFVAVPLGVFWLLLTRVRRRAEADAVARSESPVGDAPATATTQD